MLRQIVMLLAFGCLLTGFGHSSAAGDAQDEAFKKELKAMAGAWRPIFSETDGMKAPVERLKESSMTRDENGKVISRRGDMVVLEGLVKKIDATKKPRTIDTEVTSGEHKGKTIQGIYEIDGDTLRVCVVLPGKGERPTDFVAKAGSGRNLTVYKREAWEARRHQTVFFASL